MKRASTKINLTTFITIFLIHFSITLSAQGTWVWMKGSSAPFSVGTYGTMGIANNANNPPASYEGYEWTDTLGNFWLMGGGSNFMNSGNSIWKYDPHPGSPTYNQWTWVGGTTFSGVTAVHGTQGVFSPANTPGGRGVGVCSWVDKDGYFWILGGEVPWGYPYLMNDLWKYDPHPGSPTFNQWAWMKGNSAPGQNNAVYGTKGVSAPLNTPGSRNELSCTWTDDYGNLWMFGGLRALGNIVSNELWKYNPATNEWTWMSGDNTANQPGVYGTKGVASPTNKPGARVVFSSWKDKNGKLWMFGGSGYDKNGRDGNLNDLWRYDPDPLSPTYNQWTWISGSDTTGQVDNYGIKCVEASTNMPGARYENRVRWTDDCGNLWMMGGFDQVGSAFLDTHNDLWKFNITTNKWTWVSGDNTLNPVGVYGTQGVPAPTNKPGGRGGALSWKGEDGLWLFGGSINGNLSITNDLWKYMPDKPSAAFTPSTNSGCAPLNVNFNNNSVANCDEIKSHEWNFNDPSSGTLNTSSASNPTHTFNSTGSYTVTLIVTNCLGRKDTASQIINVIQSSVLSSSNSSSICSGSSVTISAGGATSYTWYPSSGLNSSTGSSVIASPTSTTNYTVSGVGNCGPASAVITVSVLPLPTITSTGNITACQGANFTMTASGAVNYLWSPTGGLSSSTGQSVIATITSPTTFTTIGTDANGCTASTITTASIIPLPSINVSPDNTICNGDSAIVTASGAISYTYSPTTSTYLINDSTLTVYPSTTITYTISGTDMNGCTNSSYITITVGNPIAFAGNDTTINYGSSASLTASGGTSYTWWPSQNLSCDNCENPNASPKNTTKYYVSITDENGCITIDSVLVIVEIACNGKIFVPNVFSPNNDGQNDVLYLKAGCIKNLTFTVYNRWGEKVFETNNIDDGWDGTFRGTSCNSGVFALNIIAGLENGETVTLQKNVTLIR